ncbi:MAG: 50S ribosomal protein L24 [Phycisphaerae bacterium]
MASRIRKDDIVEVISGDHRGQRGKVLRVNSLRGLVVVEGVNMVFRHVRPSRRNPQGGRLQKEAPIHVSNVLAVDIKAGRPSRIRFEMQRDAQGKVVSKRRVCVGSGTVLSEVTRAERSA